MQYLLQVAGFFSVLMLSDQSLDVMFFSSFDVSIPRISHLYQD